MSVNIRTNLVNNSMWDEWATLFDSVIYDSDAQRNKYDDIVTALTIEKKSKRWGEKSIVMGGLGDFVVKAEGEAAKQAAINSVKAKNHLATGASLDVGDTGEDIPADMIEMYKEAFPDRPMAELKALYNKAIKARR